MTKPKGIPASDVCDVSLFATAPAGAAPKPGGNTAQKEELQSDSSGGNAAQESAEAASKAATPSTKSVTKTDMAGAWLLDDPVTTGGDTAQEETRQTSPSGGNVAPIAEQSESTGESEDGGQVATPSGPDNHSDISAELGDWSPEVEDAPNEAHIIPGQGEAVPATVEHEPPVTQPTAEDGSWLLSEEPNDSPQPVDPVEGKTQGSPQAAPADKAETASGAAEQLEAAESGQDGAESSSPIQRRLKKRGGAAGRQGRKASSSEAPADQGKQASQEKAGKGSAKPGGAKAEVNGVPKLFS